MTELSDSESTAGARLLIVARRYDQDWQEGGARRKRTTVLTQQDVALFLGVQLCNL